MSHCGNDELRSERRIDRSTNDLGILNTNRISIPDQSGDCQSEAILNCHQDLRGRIRLPTPEHVELIDPVAMGPMVSCKPRRVD